MAEPTTENSGTGLLTEKQLSLILSTWQLCKAGEDETDGLRKTGIIMFMKLFEISPDLLGLFPFADEPKINEETEGLQKHGLDVMKTIDTAITMIIEDKISELVEVLIDLGVSHSLRNVETAHFAPVAEALLHALETRAGNTFTEEAKAAWVFLYSVVQAKMTEGLEALEDM